MDCVSFCLIIFGLFELHFVGCLFQLNRLYVRVDLNHKVDNKYINKRIFINMIQLNIKVGDTILMGRFKNKKVVVKSITYDQYGLPLVNGKPICNFRYS